MKRLDEQFQTEAQKIRLTDAERVRIRAALSEYMSYRPLRKTTTVGVGRQPSWWSDAAGVFLRHYTAMALIVVMVVGSTGVAFAAEEAGPGDPLYAFKLHVNEEVVGVLSFGPEAKTTWEVRRAERRLEEASRLAADGELTSVMSQEVAAHFALHTKRVQEDTESIEESDPVLAAEVSTQFEDALLAHEAILVSLAIEDDSSSENSEAVEMLASAVRGAADEAGRIREEVEEVMAAAFEVVGAASSSVDSASSSEPKSAEGQRLLALRTKERAEEVVRRAETRVKRESFISDRSLTTEEEKLAIIQDLLSVGDSAYGSDSHLEAYRAYRDAASRADKLIRFMEAAEQYAIDAGEVDDAFTSALGMGKHSQSTTNTSENVLAGLLEELETALEDGNNPNFVATYKRAKALSVRAESAEGSGAEADAATLRDAAQVELKRALTQLVSQQSSTPEGDSTVEDVPDATPEPVEEIVITALQAETATVFSGWVTVSACESLNSGIEVLQAAEVRLAITYTNDDNCPARRAPFSAAYTGSEEVEVKEVALNQESVPFRVERRQSVRAASEVLEMIEAADAPASDEETAETEPRSFFDAFFDSVSGRR